MPIFGLQWALGEKNAFYGRPYHWHDNFSGNILPVYKNFLLGQTDATGIDGHEELSDDEIDAIAPYLFDDIDFFLFCRDIFLSLIPSDGQVEDEHCVRME
jgi:hypothetical protein